MDVATAVAVEVFVALGEAVTVNATFGVIVAVEVSVALGEGVALNATFGVIVAGIIRPPRGRDAGTTI
ncbi:MAG: hypothetical protein EBT00_02195 [Proteobacteria bacterium]|nr:hypothetical protein [Pseudomonadota bacterium]